MHNLRKEEEWQDDENLTTADIASERAARKPQLVNERDRVVEQNRGPIEMQRETGEQSGTREALFPENEVQDMRTRWDKIQTGFVDEPRNAVQQADGLVASAIKRIAEQFAQERSQLEQQWDRGDNVSTEDLRQALRRYRAFFDRLLSM